MNNRSRDERTHGADNLIDNPLDKPKHDRKPDADDGTPYPGDKLITNPLDKPGARDNLIDNPLDKK
jgi:hypothetical protein